MIDVRAPDMPPEGVQRRRWWVAFLVVLLVLLTGGALLGGRSERLGARPARVTPPPSAPLRAATKRFARPPIPVSPRSAASLRAPASVPSRALPVNVLRLPGAVPTRAAGKFVYASGSGRVLGRKGPIRRFRVAVERGSGEDVASFAAQVEAALGDSRSWVGDGRLRMQRVSSAVHADFTVFLATRQAAQAMCARGGADIKIAGDLYTSCRTTGRAIINLDRWRLSAPTYLAARVPLAVYRQYVINHEVGHELGHQHVG